MRVYTKSGKFWSAIVFLTTLLLISGLTATASAQEPKKTKSPARGDKLDVSDLEQKYWAPKDTDFKVVQNRTYSKKNRFAFSYGIGPIVNDFYSTGLNHAFSFNYYLSERMGFEVNYIYSQLRKSPAVKAFEAESTFGGTSPHHNRMTSSAGIAFNWVPIYAKVSFLAAKILYFDLSISPGLTMVSYDHNLEDEAKSGQSIAFTLDIAQHFFLSRYWAVRFDLRNMWFQEDILNFKDASTKVRTNTNNTTIFTAGFTYYF